MSTIEHPLLVLTPRPWKWLRVLTICLLFTVGGWWMAHHRIPSRTLDAVRAESFTARMMYAITYICVYKTPAP